MPLEYDPDYLEVAGPIIEMIKAVPNSVQGDLEAARIGMSQLVKMLLSNELGEVEPSDEDGLYHTKTADGHDLAIHHFIPRTAGATASSPALSSGQTTPTGGTASASTSASALQGNIKENTPDAALYHIHGAGLLGGNVPLFASLCRLLAEASGKHLFSVDYRITPGVLPLTPLEDCYTGLQWLQSSAERLNIDPARIGVIGESDGGGLAAALCLYAKSQGFSPPIKKVQMTYPMLDDRNIVPNPDIDRDGLLWSYALNKAGWEARLGKEGGDDHGSPVTTEDKGVDIMVAPARATDDDLKGFPPAYIDVGSIDIFRDEDVEFAKRLWKVGTPAKLHVWPGVPHIFELFAPEIPITQTAIATRMAFWEDL